MSKHFFAAQKQFRTLRLLDLKELPKKVSEKLVSTEWAKLEKPVQLSYSHCNGRHPAGSPFFLPETDRKDDPKEEVVQREDIPKEDPKDACAKSTSSSSSSSTSRDPKSKERILLNSSGVSEEGSSLKKQIPDSGDFVERNAAKTVVEAASETPAISSPKGNRGATSSSAKPTEVLNGSSPPLTKMRSSRSTSTMAMIEAQKKAHEADKLMVARKKKFKEEPLAKILEKTGERPAKKAKVELPPEPVFRKRTTMEQPVFQKRAVDLDEDSSGPAVGGCAGGGNFKQKLQVAHDQIKNSVSTKKNISLEDVARSLDQSKLKCDSAFDVMMQDMERGRGDVLDDADQLVVTDASDTRDAQACMRDRMVEIQREERLRAAIEAARKAK